MNIKELSDAELALTPEELNARASQLLSQLHQYTFSNLPALLNRIIVNKLWKKMPSKFNNFGEYALSQSVDGLGINSNEKLWLLRCAIDANGKHINEWKDVLLTLETMIKSQPKSLPLNQSAISLEKLAKSPELGNKMTYYPSKNRGVDGDILKLNSQGNRFLDQIAEGTISRSEALKNAGFFNPNRDFNRAKSALNKLNKDDLSKLISWMKDNDYF